MKQTENNGIEFEAWTPSVEELEISRKSFRTPIGDSDDITLQINDQPFEIVNVTPKGIGIGINATDVFSIGQMIDTISLALEGTSLTFQGVVRHISPMEPDGFLCGIELIKPSEDNERKLRKFIRKKINSLLTDSITESRRQLEGTG